MKKVVARTTLGAQDLYCGAPDIEGAIVKKVVYGDESQCETTLIFEKNGREIWNLKIKHG